MRFPLKEPQVACMLIELFYIGMPVVRMDGRAGVWSRDYQNFSDAQVTKFSYPWCSAARERALLISRR